MQRRAFTLIEMLVVVGVLIILALILVQTLPGHRSGDNGNRADCQSNLKQLALSMISYVEDYDGLYPMTAFSQKPRGKSFVYGWSDALQSYIGSLKVRRCPSMRPARSLSIAPAKRCFTDYWLNSNLAVREEAKLPQPSRTILMGDGNDGLDRTNASYNLNRLPDAWLGDAKSPAYRHQGGANYSFADGHVK